MKALIFNSGLGSRMGELTRNNPKSMVKLGNGETIFERQLRLLSENGIKDFLITTGPYEEQLIAVSKNPAFKDCRFTFVNNPIYDKTNYIYSFYLAKDKIDDDFLVLHGDLVFDNDVVGYILNAPESSTCMINKKKALPDKDFKGRIIDGRLHEVSISIFDENCFTFQPFYKLDLKTITAWLDRVTEFIEVRGIDKVYAENALNEIASELNIVPLSYANYYVEEIDNAEDYVRVCRDIEEFDAKEQLCLSSFGEIEGYLKRHGLSKPLVILDGFLKGSPVCESLKSFANPVFFSDFKPNPTYSDVLAARAVMRSEGCDCLISIGGGSAIDTAKAVKLFHPHEGEEGLLTRELRYVNLKHIAVPTTAGTGSESTKYSVVYYEGKKQSLTGQLLLPDAYVLDTAFLKTLPASQKAATVLDALCQATESLWSVNAKDASDAYAEEAIGLILKHVKGYMAGNEGDLAPIQKAANLAGKAINITATTAAHAMSYKITSEFGIPHGIAVAMCMSPVWDFYNKNVGKSARYALASENICRAYGTATLEGARSIFDRLYKELHPTPKRSCTDSELDMLVREVNPERLKNYPVLVGAEDVRKLYLQVFDER